LTIILIAKYFSLQTIGKKLCLFLVARQKIGHNFLLIGKFVRFFCFFAFFFSYLLSFVSMLGSALHLMLPFKICSMRFDFNNSMYFSGTHMYISELPGIVCFQLLQLMFVKMDKQGTSNFGLLNHFYALLLNKKM